MSRLNRFRIDTNSHTALMGSYLASHAIRDSVIILAMGVGCESKVTHNTQDHDNVEDFPSRMAWSEFLEKDYISGNLDKLERVILGQKDRLNVGFIPVVVSPFVKTLGLDVENKIKEIQEKIEVPVRFISLSGNDSSMWEGYLGVMKEFASTIDWNPNNIMKRSVNIWGYPFDRYEGDHIGNVKFMREMLKKLGIEVKSVFFSGSYSDEMRKAGQAEYNVILPHAAQLGTYLEGLTSRPSVYADFPLGVEGTKKWIKTIASKVSASKLKTITELENIDNQKKDLVLSDRSDGKLRNAMLILDVPWIAGVSSMLKECSVQTKVVVIKDGFFSEDILESMFYYYGLDVGDVIIEKTKSLAKITDIANSNGIDVVMGSTSDLLGFDEKDEKNFSGLRKIVFGFPSYDFHPGKEPFSFFGIEGLKNLRKLLDD